uniref:Uncharacterized protein n=1 Tax=Anguilla anguilla TaxID=7936 RepID=A0A0E9SEJ7_ANGAN
MSTRKSEQAD